MRCRLAIVAAVALLAAALPAAVRGEQGGAAGKRVLALISSEDMRNTHSQFFQGLRDAGLEVDVRGHKESDLVLRKHDDAVYGHLILFTPRANGAGRGRGRGSLRVYTHVCLLACVVPALWWSNTRGRERDP